MVVEKLRPAIEKCRLVLVALDNELFATAEPVAAVIEIRDYATDEKIGPAPGNTENPGEHGGGRRLAVSAGYNDRSVAADEIVFEKLRHRTVRNFLVEDDFQLRVAARDHIADNDQIWNRLQIFRAEAFVPGNAERIKQCRGGRI